MFPSSLFTTIRRRLEEHTLADLRNTNPASRESVSKRGGEMCMFWGPHHYYMWGGSGFWGFPSLLSILFFVGILILIFSLFRKSDNSEEIEEDDTALEILKKRYAKGEITKREFEQMKRDIR